MLLLFYCPLLTLSLTGGAPPSLDQAIRGHTAVMAKLIEAGARIDTRTGEFLLYHPRRLLRSPRC